MTVNFLDISFFCYLHDSFAFLGALLSNMVDYLKYFRGASAPWEPRSTGMFPFSPWTFCLCAYRSLIIVGQPKDVLRSLAPTPHVLNN